MSKDDRSATLVPAVVAPVEPPVMHRLGPWVPHQPESAAGWWVVAYADDLRDVGSGDGGYSEEEAHVMAAGPAMAAALDCIVHRLQMDVDDGSRPDQWTMECLIRTAKAALPAGWVLGAQQDGQLPLYDQAAVDAVAAGAAVYKDLWHEADDDRNRLRVALREVLEFQSDPKAPTIHDFGRWRRVAEGLVV